MNIEEMLKKLSIDEKIRLLSGVGDWHTYDANGKLPVIMMTDGPHGLRKMEHEKAGDIESSKPATCFPTASAMACSWDPELTYKMGRAIGREAKKEKISIVLGCGVNIKRSPLCGRNFEYFSEDPFLAGKLGAGFIKGVQSENVGTSLKHYAVNSQETRRMTSNSQVDERALREIYLSAFEEVVKTANPTTIMASYNRINGEFGAANAHLLKDILRDTWGYKGAVVSDWGATINPVKCFKSGLTLEMPDSRGYHTGQLKEAYNNGLVSEEEMNEWAGNVLLHFTALSEKTEENAAVDYEEHYRLSRELEDNSAVLLKNDGVLPVSQTKKLIIVGEMAKNMRYQGGGSSHINAILRKDSIEAFTGAGYDVIYAQGYRNGSDRKDKKLFDEAVKTVKENLDSGDFVVLFFMGLTDAYESEGYDRKTLAVPGNQTELLGEISKIAGKENVSAITFGGAPMDFSFDSNVSAVLHMYLGGEAVGDAVCDLVSGKVNPSGKLAETIPLSKEDTPADRYYAPMTDDVEYRESIFVGYRYYETFNVPVKYPFGHGLSYTSFEYSDMEVPDVFDGGNVAVSLTVKNTGDVPGCETVEIYVQPEREDFIRSSIELKGFKKIYLEPGEEKRVSVELDPRSFSVFDTNENDFSVIAGVYTVSAGASVRDLKLSRNIVVQGNRYFRNERLLFPDYFKEQKHGMEVSKEQFEELLGKPLSNLSGRKRGEFEMACSFGDVSRQSLFGKTVRIAVAVALRLMFGGKGKNSPEFLMMKMGIEEGNLEGLISTSGGAVSAKLGEMLVLNANRQYKKAFLRLFKNDEA